MKVPRDLSGADRGKALERRYRVTRQTGSHMRLTTEQAGIHHVSAPLRIGTLSAICRRYPSTWE
jgi:predicted RNA binding protein YcfA (HicA-like mRNA interferase family)